MKFPIYNNRELIGFASSPAQAVKQVKKQLSVPACMTITAWMRSDDMCQILGLPKGYVYSVSYSSK